MVDFKVTIQGDTHTHTHKTGIIFWSQAPCSTEFPLSLCSRNHLNQCTSWHCCERLHLASVNIFEDFLNIFVHFMMGNLWVHLPTLHWVFSSFWPKTIWPPSPTIPIHQISPWATFFGFPKGKSPQREMVCRCGKGGTNKQSRSTKRHQNQWVQNLFLKTGFSTQNLSGKNILIGVLHQVESTLKVTDV